MNERLKRLKSDIAKNNLDAIIVTIGQDVKYISGFAGDYGAGWLLVTKDRDLFITDSRYEVPAHNYVKEFEICIYPKGSSIIKEICRFISMENVKRCGYIASSTYCAVVDELKNIATNTQFIGCESYVGNQRMLKTKEEIELIKIACNISENAFYKVLGLIKPGMSEIDIACEIDYQLRKLGGDGACFDTIVASGPINGADCHAIPSRRIIEEGDFVTMDFGTGYKGYCSDITRTVAIGNPKSKEMETIYNVVRDAKRKAEKILAQGLKLSVLDGAIRGHIEDNGYILPHGPGHGFGLNIHENPFIGPTNEYCMEAGVVHTIEPGIYVSGVCGVRIEDDYLITENGYERLTNITDELIKLC